MMASTMAARKREPGEIVMVSPVMAVLLSLLNAYSKPMFRTLEKDRAKRPTCHRQVVYQSECGDHRLHERHWVEVHWWKHAGHTPPVSNVFHEWPQLQAQ